MKTIYSISTVSLLILLTLHAGLLRAQDGNVGIGTNTPQDKLHIVGGDIRLSASPARLFFEYDGEIVSLDNSRRIIFSSTPNALISVYDKFNWQSSSMGTAMELDAVTGNLGIGLTGAAQRLHVLGNARLSALAGTGTRLVFTTADGDFTHLPNGSEGQILQVVGGSASWQDAPPQDDNDWTVDPGNTLMYTTNLSYRVGIGTAAPTGKLTVFGSSMQDLTLQVNDNSLNQGIAFQNSGAAYTWNIYRKDIGGNLANLVFSNGLDASIGNLTEVVTFKHGGNVGIGSSDPSERLEVYPDADVSAEIGRVHIGSMGWSDEAGFSHFDANGQTTYALLQNTSGRTLLNSAAGQTLGFRIGNTQHMTMESTGIIDIEKGVRFDCNSCGDNTNLNGANNWGDLTIQGRIISGNGNIHLSPPAGSFVVINHNFRAAGGSSTGTKGGLQVDGRAKVTETTFTRSLVVTDYTSVNGAGDNPSGWDEAICPNGWAMVGYSIYNKGFLLYGAYSDGSAQVKILCANLTGVISGSVVRTGNSIATLDNAFHNVDCSASELARGIGFALIDDPGIPGQVYDNFRLTCSSVQSGYTKGTDFEALPGGNARARVLDGNDAMEMWHSAQCPAGSFVSGTSVYAGSQQLENGLQLRCASISMN